jgi:hypothetical protein|tara:strand:- start:75 stop:305 length:231 start_codon:yes stop_codon:yes gene_type:complete
MKNKMEMKNNINLNPSILSINNKPRNQRNDTLNKQQSFATAVSKVNLNNEVTEESPQSKGIMITNLEGTHSSTYNE